MGFHNFIKVNMICQLFNSINDTGKTIRKYKKEIFVISSSSPLQVNIWQSMKICKWKPVQIGVFLPLYNNIKIY